MLEQVYKALFERHLRYGDIVWNAVSDSILSQSQILQIRARKLIEEAKYKDGWNCNWMDVKSLISIYQRFMTYKILHGQPPDNLRRKFVVRSMISEYGTRYRRDLRILKVRLEYASEIFTSRVSKMWMKVLTTFENKIDSLRLKAS